MKVKRDKGVKSLFFKDKLLDNINENVSSRALNLVIGLSLKITKLRSLPLKKMIFSAAKYNYVVKNPFVTKRNLLT